jgi:hypothetical protein
LAKETKPLVIGPFSGGLNTRSDISAVKDDECVEALNFDVDLDGSLKSRPPFQDLETPLSLGTTGHPKLLGYYYDTSGWYLLASDGLSSTYSYTSGGGWSLITDTFAATAMVQFDDKAWLLADPSETDPGGNWTPGGGFTADSDMPKGTTITAHKYRLWVSPGKGNTDGGRVYYSKVLGQADFWDSPGFQEIGTGDGQDVVYLTTYYNNLLIFRTMSIYGWQFTNDPGAGEIGVVVPGVGMANSDCAVAFENTIYFMYDDRAYGFINNRAYQINEQVPFTFTSPLTSQEFSVGQFNKRILFTYYDTTYVYSLYTKTWTRWRSQTHGAVAQFMSPSAGDTDDIAYAISAEIVADGADREVGLFRIEDRVTNAAENFQCVLQTKNFNYQLASNYKRLFWWGIDAIFNDAIVGQAIPVATARGITWGQILSNGITWAALRQGTWGSPYVSDTLVQTTNYDASGLSNSRKFAKFKKSLWFRQIYFRVTFDTTGAIGSAPVQLFSISAYVTAKQTLSKAIN